MSSFVRYAEIVKRDDDQRLVYGYASTEALDSQGERVLKSAVEQALPDYMRWANVREMHQPSAVGVAKSANIDENGLYLKAKIVDDEAWNKVKEGVYKGFSIGGQSLEKEDGVVSKLVLKEISLVDRPANPECRIDVFKVDEGVIAQALLDVHKAKEAAVGELAELLKEGKVDPRSLLTLAKRDFSDKERSKLADKGHALPDGSFPIVNKDDLKNAIRAFGRAKDKAAAKKHIIQRAKDLDATDLLPSDWNGSTKEKDGGDDGKAATAGDLKKGLSEVGWFTSLLDSISAFQCCNAWEQAVEGDTESQMPEQLKDWLEEGLRLLAEMVTEEAAELMQTAPLIPRPAPADDGAVAAAAKAGDLAKTGARFSADTKVALADIHNDLRKCVEKMDGLGYAENTNGGDGKDGDGKDGKGSQGNGDGDGKADAALPLAKIAELTAAVSKIPEELAKAIERIKRLEAQPAPAKGPLRAITKGDDVTTGDAHTPTVEPIRKQDGSPNEVASLIKAEHAAGGQPIPFLGQPFPTNLGRK